MSKKLDKFYAKPDPWGYQTNPDDAERKRIILDCLKRFGQFERALDVGCGEGWITADLPAKDIWGFDVSSTALTRTPACVRAVSNPGRIYGKFDLVIATGVLYDHYDPEPLLAMIRKLANHVVLTCHISHKESAGVPSLGLCTTLRNFPYRDMTERLRIFEVKNDQDTGKT